MAQNFLYMFEFVVDDLLVTRPNKCAPEEYPTCCEISFRSSVFVAICDREYGYCVDTCAPKCGKCCLFSLESPITDKDRLLIHVYKKKDNNCKFLLGAADLKIKPLFDMVTHNFDIENPQWMEAVARHNACLPDPQHGIRRGGSTTATHNNRNNFNCDDVEGRKEQFCPTSELSKNLLPLFSMKGEQTGNLMLITRLVCNGPAIVSTFPFAKFCQLGCKPSSNKSKRSKSCTSKTRTSSNATLPYAEQTCKMNNNPCSKKKPVEDSCCRRYFTCSPEDECTCAECADYGDYSCGMSSKETRKSRSQYDLPPCPNDCDDFALCKNSKLKKQKTKFSSSPCMKNPNADDRGLCSMPDPCLKPESTQPACLRYFACNADKGCPCNECLDEFDRTCPKPCKPSKRKSHKIKCPTPRQTGGESRCELKPKSSGSQCNVCSSTSGSVDDEDMSGSRSMAPCYIEPSRSKPGPEAYEEFEACLNGSGLTVRVLKDTHRMDSVYDGTEANMEDSDDDDACCDPNSNNCGNAASTCAKLEDLLNTNFARKRTGGRIVNHPSIPKVRANVKYAGADTGCVESYKLPFSKFKDQCQSTNKLDKYRKKQICDCGPIVPPRHLDDSRSCCLQVDPKDIKNLLKGVNADSRKKGIEVCYRTCEDNESDVFLVKLGAKKSCEHKQHSVEIELRTPKIPIPCAVQKCTTETQLKEGEIDAALRDVCRKGKKGKGKKGKK